MTRVFAGRLLESGRKYAVADKADETVARHVWSPYLKAAYAPPEELPAKE
jgi:hypothetical protein